MGCCFVKPPIPESPKTIAIIIPADQQHYYEDLTYGQPYTPPTPIRIPRVPRSPTYWSEDPV